MSGFAGIMMAAAASATVAFTPVTRIYTTPGSAIETIPTGASNLVIELFGAGGGGGGKTGSIPNHTLSPGYGGGSGGYTRSSFSVVGHNGQTIDYTLGAGGALGGIGFYGSPGGSSYVGNAGTFTMTEMFSNPGGGGADGSGSTPGAGGTASGGNATNTAGNPGSGITGGAGIVGIYDTGTKGGTGGPGTTAGGNAIAVFHYT